MCIYILKTATRLFLKRVIGQILVDFCVSQSRTINIKCFSFPEKEFSHMYACFQGELNSEHLSQTNFLNRMVLQPDVVHLLLQGYPQRAKL